MLFEIILMNISKELLYNGIIITICIQNGERKNRSTHEQFPRTTNEDNKIIRCFKPKGRFVGNSMAQHKSSANRLAMKNMEMSIVCEIKFEGVDEVAMVRNTKFGQTVWPSYSPDSTAAIHFITVMALLD